MKILVRIWQSSVKRRTRRDGWKADSRSGSSGTGFFDMNALSLILFPGASPALSIAFCTLILQTFYLSR